jgi:hypothetical protein
MEIHMRLHFLFTCSALLVALMGFGISPASACGGYYGYGYGYGYGCRCPGYGYGSYYRAADVYYAPRYYGRGWGYGPRAYGGYRRVGLRRW